MAEQQQKCGKCGAVNSADAVTCVNCGTVLAAYASASVPESDSTSVPAAEPKPVDAEPETPVELASETKPGKPTEKSSDWRDLFSHAPGADEPAPSFDALPAAPAIPLPPESAISGIDEITAATEDESPEPADQPDIEPVAPVATPAPAAEPAASPTVAVRPQPEPSRPKARAYPVPPTQEPPSFDSRMVRFDRGISTRSPQKLILYGILIFVLGCVLAMILSALGASDSLVGLLFICAGPIGLIVAVIGIILAVARREGRQR